MARPESQFSEEQRETIKAMAGYGIQHHLIALVMNVAEKTLRKHCKVELDTGGVLATTKVAESLYNQAISGNTAACIFWMKARAGWSETITLSGSLDHHIISDRPMTDDEWEKQYADSLGPTNGSAESTH